MDVILYSKDADHGRDVEIGAANAITILNAAYISFGNLNLSNIRIPRADLSYGLFDGCDLSRANLTCVDFTSAWLRMRYLQRLQCAMSILVKTHIYLSNMKLLIYVFLNRGYLQLLKNLTFTFMYTTQWL